MYNEENAKAGEMMIREYVPADEREWLRCRVLSFLDCSYWNDVKTVKETYAHPSISLVAEADGHIVGLIELEIDSDELYGYGEGRGAMLWHMAVLPEYRRCGIAQALWRAAERRLQEAGIAYCELWTQEDEPANRFYKRMGFEQQTESTWIRCYAHGEAARRLMNLDAAGDIYGVEEIVFQAEYARKAELSAVCDRIDEVRLYAKRL